MANHLAACSVYTRQGYYVGRPGSRRASVASHRNSICMISGCFCRGAAPPCRFPARPSALAWGLRARAPRSRPGTHRSNGQWDRVFGNIMQPEGHGESRLFGNACRYAARHRPHATPNRPARQLPTATARPSRYATPLLLTVSRGGRLRRFVLPAACWCAPASRARALCI